MLIYVSIILLIKLLLKQYLSCQKCGSLSANTNVAHNNLVLVVANTHFTVWSSEPVVSAHLGVRKTFSYSIPPIRSVVLKFRLYSV